MDRIDISICLAVDCASVQADLVLSEIMRILTHEGFNILAGGCVNE
jgi:hypothetical protein